MKKQIKDQDLLQISKIPNKLPSWTLRRDNCLMIWKFYLLLEETLELDEMLELESVLRRDFFQYFLSFIRSGYLINRPTLSSKWKSAENFKYPRMAKNGKKNYCNIPSFEQITPSPSPIPQSSSVWWGQSRMEASLLVHRTSSIPKSPETDPNWDAIVYSPPRYPSILGKKKLCK